MSKRTDGLLATIVLVVLLGTLLASDARFSPSAFAAGGVGVLLLEAAMAPVGTPVRRWWARPAVKIGSLALAIALVVAGSTVAPPSVLSAGLGAATVYLVLLASVAAGVLPPVTEWF